MIERRLDMNFFEKLMQIDRRWVYLAIGLAVLVPTIWSFDITVTPTPEVKKVYNFVDSLQAGQYLFICVDYDPSSMAELNPMTTAIVNQAFEKDIKIVFVTLSQFGPGLVEQITSGLAANHNKKNGIDYAFLGYRPYPAIVILAMGVDFRVPFPQDYYGTPLDSLPVMDGIKNFDDVKGVIEITSGNTADFWLTYGNGRYGFPLAIGITGVMSANYYQYLSSGQLFGIIPGVKGAAEYEELVGYPGEGKAQMAYQVIAHAVILLFIIISNIAYFASRKRKSGLEGGAR
jgi:hypothetical protein